MLDRINLTQLRAGCESKRAAYQGTDLEALANVSVHADTLLALIDTAEAAQAFERIPDKWANGDERDRLRQSLARFTIDPPGRSHPDPFIQGG